jgi:hypothetical protein
MWFALVEFHSNHSREGADHPKFKASLGYIYIS